LQKRHRTFSYFVFYILFLPDTWQILIGVAAAYFLAPFAITPETGLGGRIMLYIMMATIGYAASRMPARGICRIIKKMILGDKLN
jgi:TRAP-type mannitol/chloroaromatic compound transport system permease small subunit